MPMPIRLGAALALATLALAAPCGAQALQELFDQAWEADLAANPVRASMLGDRRYNDRWPDLDPAAIEARHAADRAILDALTRIDRAALDDADRLNYDLFERSYRQRVDNHRYRAYLRPLNQRGGIQTADQLTERLRFTTLQDYRDWIARLRTFDVYMDQTMALMRLAIAEGRTHPRIVMARVPAQIERQVVAADRSPFLAPFEDLPSGIGEAQAGPLRGEALAAVEEVVVPAYRRFLAFFTDEYLPACRETVGAWDLPDGADYYAQRTRDFTTTDLTPDEIHEIGLAEVERIRDAMLAIIDEVGFEGSFADFLQFLRTDPQFYYDDPDELLNAYLATSKRIDPELVRLFGRLPRMPYGVRPIPAASAPDTTTAYYSRPAADGSRAGYYYVNLYRPEVRPKYEIEVLTVHEAMPGHHLQIALAQELGELPAFRRYGGYTAFVEGWALYSESLGEDLGLYEDPYSKFGQLTYEMWRAVRLVVDTGIHHKRWPRDKAIDFFAANAAKTEHDIVNEIDRYIAWPGQALAYKIGELKIKALRSRAERTLGDAFDVRAFHDVVLGSGAVPLDALERIVDDWIEESRP